MQGVGQDRIAGLDIWRVVLMLGGALVHGSFLQDERPLFVAIGLVSGAFRMGAFFAISGLLAALSLARRSPDAWRDRRDVEIGLPTAFGLLVLCPAVQLMLAAHRAGTIAAVPLSFEMHHLWFLVALMVYTRAGYVLDRLDRRHALVARLEAVAALPSGPAALLLAIGGVIFTVMALVGGGLDALPGVPQALNVWHMQQIAGYAPMFLFGMALARSTRLREAMLAGRAAPIAILLIAGIGHLAWWFGIMPHMDAGSAAWIDQAVHIAGAAVCPPAATILILRSALAIRHTTPLVRSVCAASFTIYMLHFPIAVMLNIALSHVAANVYLEYAFVVVASVAAAWWLHWAMVARVPILAALLNGRGRTPAAAAAA